MVLNTIWLENQIKKKIMIIFKAITQLTAKNLFKQLLI